MIIKPYKGIHPKIHPTVFIVESAVIIGNVEIGEYSSVWFNAVVRGDVNYIRIGDRTNIQDICMLHVTKNTHPLILGSDITVGHSVTLHGCTIKDRCLIGMGATILDGAVIGEDCIIGAGALVTEGAVIPPGTLAIGMPAKPKRDLTDAEKARIRQSAQNYIDYSKTYGG
ncbi:MAG: gamma carbonic anhydrase family protein [Nitrospirae bacterium]|nr:gamma carbonic anhydrase family protein [Nitrospirota bacterium]